MIDLDKHEQRLHMEVHNLVRAVKYGCSDSYIAKWKRFLLYDVERLIAGDWV